MARGTRRAPHAHRPRLPQLRTRVLAGVLAVTLLALAAFDIAAVTALRRYLLSHTDAQLLTVSSLYRPLAGLPVRPPAQVRSPGPARPPVPVSRPAQHVTFSGPRVKLPPPLGQYYVMYVPGPGGGQPVAFVKGNPALMPPAQGNWTTDARVHAQTLAAAKGKAQLRLLSVPMAGGALLASTSLSTVNSTVGRLELIVIISSVAAALLVALGVGWVMRRGLHPIETMAAEAEQITAGDLTHRVSPHDTATEVGRLGVALNGMLTRIETAIAEREASQDTMRRFFADTSHELRNPLASLRANAELYQQGALPQRRQVDEAMRRIALEAQRMSGLVDDMLRLARLDQQPAQRNDPVDVTALVAECTQRAQVAGAQRAWRAQIADGLVVTGDEELLRRAVDNLLANVRAHTPPGTTATVTAASGGGSVVVAVRDDGPGVPASQLPRIFNRFYRATGQPHHPGSGLGLAIVSAIATAHNGTAQAAVTHPHGLRITLTLPESGQPALAGVGSRPGSGSLESQA